MSRDFTCRLRPHCEILFFGNCVCQCCGQHWAGFAYEREGNYQVDWFEVETGCMCVLPVILKRVSNQR
jgi:hypothetical protein